MQREVALTSVTTSPTTGKKIQFIRLTETEMKGGIAVSNRVGFILVDPLKAKEVVKAIEDNKIVLEFGGRNRQTGLLEVQAILTPEYEAELAAAEANNAAASAQPQPQGAGVIKHD